MFTLLEFALQNLLFFGLHLDSRSSFPKQLTPKEEEECIARIAQGDMEARSRLIEHNLRLVAYIVSKNYPEHVRGGQQDADDLISIGTIGLIRAAETFDYSRGKKFSTYASRCIDNAITTQRKQFAGCR
ncbi:MAG: sigma-70 family RNA polymerase sigma factor [Oscillospiraceae bacterium]